MAWINPIDRVPQIPQDWANHIAQGGLWALAVMCAVMLFGYSRPEAALFSLVLMSIVSVSKKVVDFFMESEPIWMCVGKAFVTVLWPASIWLLV